MMRMIARILGYGLVAASLLVMLAWLLGRVISDRTEFGQWLLWIPTPAALLAAFVGVLGSVLIIRAVRSRRRRLLGVFIGCSVAVLIYFACIEHRLLHGAADDPAGVTFVHWTLTEGDAANNAAINENIFALDGDITILCQAGPVRRNDDFRAWCGSEHPLRTFGPFTICSRLPITELRWVAAVDGVFIGRLTVDAGPPFNRPISIILLDLPSSPGIPRAELARRVRGFIEKQNTDDIDLFIGDCNTTRGSAALDIIAPGMRHAFDEAGHGYGATFHRQFPLYHIDHILMNDSVRCTRYDLISPGVTRHRPQKAWIIPAE